MSNPNDHQNFDGSEIAEVYVNKSFSNAKPPQLNLARSQYERPMFVDMEKFFEFSFWISEELLDLEARFKPMARTRRSVIKF